MNDSIPPSPDPGSNVIASIGDRQDPTTFSQARKFWRFLGFYIGIPVTAAALGLVVAIVICFSTPPTFVSCGTLWETEHLQLPGGAGFTDDRDNNLSTQAGLLRSKTLRHLTLNWMKNVVTNEIVLDSTGYPLEVDINFYGVTNSSVYTVEARSANADFTPAYLNALMKTYLEYRRNVRREVSGETLASISEQVQRLERDLKAGQAALKAYQQSNNFAVMQLQATIAPDCLAKLNNQLSDLQLDDLPLNHATLSEVESARHQMLQQKMEFIRNTIQEWESKVAAASARIAYADKLKQNTLRHEALYDRLATLLENVDFSRNVDLDTMAILEPASPAKRSYAREKRLLWTTGCSGLALGLGFVGLWGWYRARRRPAATATK